MSDDGCLDWCGSCGGREKELDSRWILKVESRICWWIGLWEKEGTQGFWHEPLEEWNRHYLKYGKTGMKRFGLGVRWWERGYQELSYRCSDWYVYHTFKRRCWLTSWFHVPRLQAKGKNRGVINIHTIYNTLKLDKIPKGMSVDRGKVKGLSQGTSLYTDRGDEKEAAEETKEGEPEGEGGTRGVLKAKGKKYFKGKWSHGSSLLKCQEDEDWEVDMTDYLAGFIFERGQESLDNTFEELRWFGMERMGTGTEAETGVKKGLLKKW